MDHGAKVGVVRRGLQESGCFDMEDPGSMQIAMGGRSQSNNDATKCGGGMT